MALSQGYQRKHEVILHTNFWHEVTIAALAAIGLMTAKYPVVDKSGRVKQKVENHTPFGTSAAFMLKMISLVFSFTYKSAASF